MRAIASSFFDASPAMLGPVVALLIFVVLFVAVVWSALRARPKQLERAAALVFDDVSNARPSPTAREEQP